jgi:beta-glucuronidase
MIRSFVTNHVRKSQELSESLWDFSPCAGEFSGQHYDVFVPSCWQTHPNFQMYRGVGKYTKTFTATGNIRLVFKGVSHTATVFLDGEKIATHYNAYTPFDVVVKQVKSGQHTLEVLADNRFSEQSALHVPNDYESYGGITRGVLLEELGEAFIDYVHVTPRRTDLGWQAEIAAKIVSLSDQAQELSFELVLADQKFMQSVLLPANEQIVIKGILNVEEAQEWTIENPVLYEVTSTLQAASATIDDLIERVGFRTIETKGKQILLNGRAVRIKGFCRHEDHPHFGCALPAAMIQKDLLLAKDLGANSLRTSHYPNDEIFLDFCDEQGILVWEENHARGLSLEQMQNPFFEPQAEACIEEMITAHVNHPSIIIWGILNECASQTADGYECYKKQYDLIQKLDASRPRTSASCQFKTDLCFGLPEIVSYNIYPEWYHQTPSAEYLQELYDWVQRDSEGSGKPFIISEIGAGAVYGYRSPTEVKWSEEYQAKTLKHQVEAVMEQAGCSGIYIWQFCDIRICEEWKWEERPKTMNNKGVVDEFRREKLAYQVVKNIFNRYANYFDEAE